MVNEAVLDIEKKNVVKIPINESPVDRKERYKEDRKEANRLHKLAKEELRHTKKLRKHLQPFEDNYLADAGTLVEFEVVGEKPVPREMQACPTCGRTVDEKTEYGAEGWARKSTENLEDIERHIDNIRLKAEEPTLLKRYEDKFGEKLLIKEKSRGYDWSKEIETITAEKPSWFIQEEGKEPLPEITEEGVEKKTILGKMFSSSTRNPWYSMSCLLITERFQPKNTILKYTIVIIDILLWIPLVIVRVPIFVLMKLGKMFKKKQKQ